MLQKYIALFPWGAQQTWTDMRKFHYTDIDPQQANRFMQALLTPTGTNLVSTNHG